MTLQSPRFSWRAVVAAAAFATVCAAAWPAPAQSDREIQSLIQKVQRLQRELNVLQRAVYNDEQPPEPEGDAGASETAGQGGGLSSVAAARIQRHFDQLEAEMGRLTGRIEEARFRIRKVTDRLDKLVTDVDYRLRELEQQVAGRTSDGGDGQAAAAAGAAGESGAAAQGGESQTAQAAAGDADSGGGDGEGGGGSRTLGQVSQDAVDAIRSQQAEAGNGQGTGTQTAAAPSEGYDLPDAPPGEQYEHAFGLLRQADYAKAEQALRAFVEAHPEHELAGNAKYWLGETYYVRGNFSQAAVTFAEGFQTYPDSNKAPDNLLKLGMSLAAIDRTQDACGIFAELLSRYPEAARNILQRAQREQRRLGCGG